MASQQPNTSTADITGGTILQSVCEKKNGNVDYLEMIYANEHESQNEGIGKFVVNVPNLGKVVDIRKVFNPKMPTKYVQDRKTATFHLVNKILSELRVSQFESHWHNAFMEGKPFVELCSYRNGYVKVKDNKCTIHSFEETGMEVGTDISLFPLDLLFIGIAAYNGQIDSMNKKITVDTETLERFKMPTVTEIINTAMNVSFGELETKITIAYDEIYTDETGSLGNFIFKMYWNAALVPKFD